MLHHAHWPTDQYGYLYLLPTHNGNYLLSRSGFISHDKATSQILQQLQQLPSLLRDPPSREICNCSCGQGRQGWHTTLRLGFLSDLANNNASSSTSEAHLKNNAAFRPFPFLSIHCNHNLVHAGVSQPTAKVFLFCVPPERHGIVAAIAKGLAGFDG